ncbi:hypothetical protein Golomagni_05376 [Golovinomyces magnicellulatus]|nr:hypothetical protein Golomagni_05376 [Golovinomyces magnicellulatus]
MLPSVRIATRQLSHRALSISSVGRATPSPPTSSVPRIRYPSLLFQSSFSIANNVMYRPAKEAGEREPALARPSSSVVLLSPSNEVLLLHRVKSSTSFASAHVFPGGNVDAFHDGEVPEQGNPERHQDSMVYRMCAIRETFEETGILLAKKDGKLLDLPESERDEARKLIHGNKVKFSDWLKSVGGEPDTDANDLGVAGLLPFTRWITPLPTPKRFTTQMYLYMLPLSRVGVPSQMLIPTADNGVEHTAADFGPVDKFLDQAAAKSIILFPPQVFLLHMLKPYVGTSKMGSLEEEAGRFMMQRRKLTKFLKKTPTADTDKGKRHATASISWADKVISPHHILIRESDNRIVLGLEKPGRELQGTDRGGDWERVALVKFGKGGPSEVEIRLREDVLAEEKKEKESKL